MKFKMIAAAFAVAVSAPAHAEIVNEQSIGDWQIKSEANAMTDVKSCFAIYQNRFDVQLTENTLSFSMRGRGGVRGYLLRFDNDTALPMALPTRAEERISAFFLEGTRFQRLLTAQRLRVQVLTVLTTTVNEDISTTDVPAVVAAINTCEGR